MHPNGSENIAGIILAAGRSRRFGGDKRRAAYDSKNTLLTQSIALIEPFVSQLLVVTRPDDAGKGEVLLGSWSQHPKLEQFIAPSADKGMGHSLAEAAVRVSEIETERGCEFSGVLVMLADMPKVRSATIAKVVAAADPNKIIRPCYLNESELRGGHPVLFGRFWFNALQKLQGDRGAKNIIEEHANSRIDIPVDDPGILLDVDRPEDLSLVSKW